MITRKKIRKLTIVFGASFALFATGVLFGLHSWDKNLYVSWSPSLDRSLAEEENSQTLLKISTEDLIGSVAVSVFEQSQVIEEEDTSIFYLGNVLIPDQNAQKYRFLCEVFSHIEFSFTALGVNFSGDESLMLIQSPCRSEEINQVGPFFLPRKQILAQPGQDTFEFKDIETFIRFYNASIEFMPRWFLKSLRLFKQDDDQQELILRFNPKEHKALELTITEIVETPQVIPTPIY